ncbi:MAG: cysteine--tRNA ligase [Candidatus Kerfeldbacteria bacterium]|nr:cysteine--tRNA ligase [Candidatus Kerfeldbacteria bacterium]
MVRLFNTLTRQVDAFTPLNPPSVGLYTCGPTVYNYVHLGNLRTYLFEDVLRRVLEAGGFAVKHVMNITDVGHLTSDADTGEDKVESQARKEHKDAYELARFYTQAFVHDLDALNIQRPHVMVKATSTIDLQIDLIKRLEQNGFAYLASDGVYFDTSRFPNYGRLGGQRKQDKKAGARVAVNPQKRNQNDFALWKFSKPADKRQMEWPSPWGAGFPGWHIECSAMSMHELGEQFDVHTGGVDHIPIHHENEIAQSEAATGKHPFVKYWLHGEFLVLPEKRMGKSEGNFVTLSELPKRAIHPLAFRYLVLQTHYRSKLTFSWQALEAAHQGLLNLWLTIDTQPATPKIGCAEFEQRFRDSLDNDLDTPQALAIMHEMLKSDYPWSAKLQSLEVFDRVLGIGLGNQAVRQHFPPLDDSQSAAIESLVQEREVARQQKKWDRADELRQQINQALAPFHRALQDTPTGPAIKPRFRH